MNDYWTDIKELIFDALNNVFYTDEEREDKIAEALEDFGAYTDDYSEIPGNATARSHQFYSPIDLIYWIEDAGIPPHYIYVHRHASPRNGVVQYDVYITPS